MTVSLPKPVQNDFDTIVIDILSKYSLENKSVQKFVQAVAEQTRAVLSTPRILKPVRNQTRTSTVNNETSNNQETDQTSKKPNFLTRLENLQNTFNKSGLLGVFFEFIKNRQANAQAKATTPEPVKSQQLKPLEETNTPLTTANKTETKNTEKTTTQIEKLQEAFDFKGLFDIAKDIFNHLKEQSDKKQEATTNKFKPTQSYNVSTSTYNIDSNENVANLATTQSEITNKYSTNRSTNLLPVQEGSMAQQAPFVDTEGPQAQKQNVWREFTVTLGDIEEPAETKLKNIIKSVFDEIKDESKNKKPATTETKDIKAAGAAAGGGGLADFLADLAMIGMGFGGILGRVLGGAKALIDKAMTGISSLGKGLMNLARMPAAKALTGGGGLTGLLGAGAAIVGGEMIGGAAGEAIISNEKFSEYWYGDKDAGKEAAEQFGTGITGFAKATWALGSQAIENKKSEAAANKQADQLRVKEVKLMEKVQQLGYSTKQEYKDALQAGEAPSIKWDDTKKEFIETEPKKEGLKEAVITVRKSRDEKPSLKEEPPKQVEQPVDVEAKTIEIKPTTIEAPVPQLPPEKKDNTTVAVAPAATPSALESTIQDIQPTIPVSSATAKPVASTSITPETVAAATPPTPQSIVNDYSTHGFLDEKVFKDIANHTQHTNESLKVLGNAVFSMADAFKQSKGRGTSILINGEGGQPKSYTSTAEMAEVTSEISLARRRFSTVINR